MRTIKHAIHTTCSPDCQHELPKCKLCGLNHSGSNQSWSSGHAHLSINNHQACPACHLQSMFQFITSGAGFSHSTCGLDGLRMRLLQSAQALTAWTEKQDEKHQACLRHSRCSRSVPTSTAFLTCLGADNNSTACTTCKACKPGACLCRQLY